jgi:hypothetical protein
VVAAHAQAALWTKPGARRRRRAAPWRRRHPGLQQRRHPGP